MSEWMARTKHHRAAEAACRFAGRKWRARWHYVAGYVTQAFSR